MIVSRCLVSSPLPPTQHFIKQGSIATGGMKADHHLQTLTYPTVVQGFDNDGKDLTAVHGAAFKRIVSQS